MAISTARVRAASLTDVPALVRLKFELALIDGTTDVVRASEQDWRLCEEQQRGVSSSAYTPGPYYPYKEYNVDGFVGDPVFEAALNYLYAKGVLHFNSWSTRVGQ